MRRQIFASLSLVFLLGSAVTCGVVSLGWPLLGDTTYLHYAIRLMHAGMRPYADLMEMNMPGSYIVESLAISIFGSGALGWRLFDLLLSCIACLCMMRLAPAPKAGLGAFALLYCIHLQDGVMMGGERDYSLAVLLLGAVAALLSEGRWRDVACGVLTGAGVCIKPTALVYVLPVGIWLLLESRSRLIAFLAGVLAAPLGCAAWLWHLHALHAFGHALAGLVAYHASIDNQSLWYLVTHATSPIGIVVCLWIAGSLMAREVSRTQWLMRGFALCGWVTYAAQRKGFSYQRYSFLAFFLLVLASEVPGWFRGHRPLRAIAGLMVAVSVGTAALATYRVAGYDRVPPGRLLAADIEQFNTHGKAQCLDTAGGCIAVMEQLARIQPTGLMYDCYLTRAGHPVGDELRLRVLRQFQADPPQTLVMTNSVCFNEPRSFAKYERWPEFDSWLERNYTLAAERTPVALEHYWSRRTQPFAWRIYVRR